MDLEKNKENAIAFYKTAYEGNPKKAVELYVGSSYIQHNPDVADGTEGFIDYFERMRIVEFIMKIKTYSKLVYSMNNHIRASKE